MQVNTPISAVMTTDVVTLAPNDIMAKAQEIFRTREIHHLPIVKGQQVVGIISKSDYLMLLHGFTLFNTKESRVFNESTLHSITAEDVMTNPVAMVNPEDSVETAVGMFRENRFHALPVVKKGTGQLVGIITVLDLLNYAFTNPALLTS